MKFKVPQFIERESKVVGSLTFKQFLFVGIGGFLFFALYSISSQISSSLFIILSIIIAIASLSLAFLKVEGHTLPVIVASFFNFLFMPKTYLWERKKFVSKISKKDLPEKKEEKKEDDFDIKIFKQSRLKDLSSRIEIKE